MHRIPPPKWPPQSHEPTRRIAPDPLRPRPPAQTASEARRLALSHRDERSPSHRYHRTPKAAVWLLYAAAITATLLCVAAMLALGGCSPRPDPATQAAHARVSDAIALGISGGCIPAPMSAGLGADMGLLGLAADKAEQARLWRAIVDGAGPWIERVWRWVDAEPG